MKETIIGALILIGLIVLFLTDAIEDVFLIICIGIALVGFVGVFLNLSKLIGHAFINAF